MNKITQHIQSSKFYSSEYNYFVACSGGVDSLVLLSTFHSLGHAVTAIHVNYNLRGKDSIEDMDFLKSFCLERKIPFLKKEIYLSEELKEGGNLQEKARNFRYDWFRKILAEKPKNRILLGHHLNDQIETFWMNICRDSGVMGLSGMQESNDGIFRPFLRFKKQEIISIARENNLNWREDLSNASNKYKRNFFRNEVIPFLEKEIPSISQDVELLTKTFQAKQGTIEDVVKPFLLQIRTSHHLSHLDFKKLDELEKIELARMLNVSFEHFFRLDELLYSSRGKKINLDHHENYSAIVNQADLFEFIPINSPAIPSFKIEKTSELPTEFDKTSIYLDEQKINGELNLRKWKVGDRISPIGMHGSQLISDIIKDKKLSANEKKEVLVLSDEKNIHWCVGHKIGRIAIASKNSDSIIKISIAH